MRDLASPVAAFVRERCVKGPDETIAVDELYAAYKQWAENSGHAKPSKHVFGRDIRAAAPALSVERPTDSSGREDKSSRIRVYRGIALRAEGIASDENSEDTLL